MTDPLPDTAGERIDPVEAVRKHLRAVPAMRPGDFAEVAAIVQGVVRKGATTDTIADLCVRLETLSCENAETRAAPLPTKEG